MAAIRMLALTVALWACATAVASAQPVGNTTLVVDRTGVKVGTVTDNLSRINCGLDCSGTYQRDCLQGTPDNCTEPGEAKRPTLTTTVPAGFGVAWSRACDEGSSTADRCTVDAEGSITAHYDDLSAPDVELTAPGAGPRRGTVTLSATASDDESDVTSVQFLVGGVSVGTDNNAPYQIDFDTTSRQASRSVGITIDNTVPSLTVDGPDHQTFGPGSTQRWTFAATDVTSGPPAVQCSVMPTGAAPSFGACSPGGGSHSVTNRPEGSYSARFRATDGSGNVRIVERTFSIDATPAVTRIDSGPPDGSSSADTSVTFTFSANESGATFKCRVFPAALTPGAFGPCSGTGSHTASGFAPGAYTFEVLATDPFGNTDPTSEKRTFSVTAASGGGGGGAGPGSPGVVAGRRIDARVQTFFIRFGRLTRVGRLTVIAAPRGAKVTVTCKSARHVCAFKRVVLRFNGRSLALAKRFKRRKLRARTVITIAVSKEGFVAKTFRYTLRPTRFPAVRIS